MKSVIKNFIYLLGFVFVLSCDDQLDTEPEDSVDTGTAFNTINDFRVNATGMYSGMQPRGYYGRNFPAIGDASSDNGAIPAGAGARLTSFYTLDLNSVNTAGLTWNVIYNVIARANNIINNMEGFTGGTEEDRNNIMGEALFMRALGYHDLVRLFAQDYGFTSDASHLGVPLVFEVNKDLFPARNTVAEVYEQIMTDLNTAEGLMTVETVPLADRGTLWSVRALRARVNLYMSDWEAALADADAVINSGRFVLADYSEIDSLTDNAVPPNRFGAIKSWIEVEPNSEAIFEMESNNVDYRPPNNGQLELLASIYVREAGYGDLGPSNDIRSIYTEDDYRQTWFLEDDDTWFVNKYPGQGDDPLAFTCPILRLSEMYLIKAECHAELNEDDLARDAVNMIALRANAPGITSSGIQLKEDIQEERRRELAWEGHRYFDLKRRQQDINREKTPDDCELTNGNCFIPYGDRLFTYPIPQEELDANANMRQDDLWGN